MNNKKLMAFFAVLICFNMAASFAHPVTPTLIVERSLDSSMFGVALAAMMTMNFLFSPFWGKLCGYIPTKTIMLICGIGYAIGQVVFGAATSEAMVVGGRMFAGIFTGGAFTAFSNYVINISGKDVESRGKRLVATVTIQSVAGACGYFIGGMLGLISVEAAFAAQVITLASCGVLFFLLCEDDTSYKVKQTRPLSIKDANPFAAFFSARNFMNQSLILIFIIVAIAAIGQNSYEQCFNYFIKDQYGMSSAYNGIFKAGIAILTLALNSTVCLYLQRRTDVNKTFLYVLFACTGICASILVFRNQIFFVAAYIVYSGVNAIRLPLLQSMCASRSTASSSNAIMGFYQSMNSLGGIFGALFAGLIYAKGPMFPFILAFGAYLFSSVIGILYRSRYNREKA